METSNVETLSLDPVQGNVEALPQPEKIKETDSTTILIIEDDVLQLDFLEDGLTNQGFKVLSSMTCNGGLRLAKSERPDVIVLDVLMPDGDGLILCQQLADQNETCDIPIIVVSGSDQEDIVFRSRNSGSQFFLKKPYDPNALLVLIGKALEKNCEW